MTVSVRVPEVSNPNDVLTAYVPRLVIDWLRRDPHQLHQELEGTFVFVDISGFTALSERLSRKGKIGAELMRDTLDGVFRDLLDEAYDWGAGLLKWGGDALLLFFDRPEHEKRACRAAWEMQRTIDRVGRLHLSSGTLILRMSVGIGTGTFHFFLTGSIHRELLIAGPAMTETLKMEGIADATEIGITETLASRLDPACVGPRKEEAILLVAPPEVDRRRSPDVGDVTALDIASCIPVATRAHVLLRKSEPEHRTITAAFIDMMNTDELLAELGPQRLGEGLDERIRQIEEAALEFEVPFYETDIGKSSVKALLTAGAPSSTGHDEERMLRTLRAVMEQPGLVQMRIGVNTGKVFTGDFGPPYRRAYRVFGDAINTAARVMAKAEAGQILSTEIVLNRSRTVFETTPITPFAAKGKSEPVRASIVGPRIGTREEEQGGLPLIGRDAELQVILDAVELTRSGHGVVVELGGDPGLGKSRLLEEVIARSPDFRLRKTRCEEYEASTPYYPFRAVMRSALDLDANADTDVCIRRLEEVVEQVDPSLHAWTPLLGILMGMDMPPTPETAALDERFIRDRLSEVAMKFLLRTVLGPTMFAFEDAHFMDEASRDLLTRLFQARESHRALLVLTHQEDKRILEVPEGQDRECVFLTLNPLSSERLEEIVDLATEESPLLPHEVEEIARRSGGNTLFLFDLIRAYQASGSLESLPDSVESSIAGQIDRLGPSDRMILRYASVLGASFDPEMLEEVVRDDVDFDEGVWNRLSALLRPEDPGKYRFRTTLVRDAAYEGLPYRRRRALHNRVGETIEANAGISTEEELGTLALHFHEAQRWDKSWDYSRQAGDRAMRIYANVEASRFYEKAVSAGRRLRTVRGPELGQIYERWADALFLLGQYEDADRALAAARRLTGRDPVANAPLVAKQANITNRVGRYRQSTARVTRSLHALTGRRGTLASASRARLMVLYAATRFAQNRRTDSIRLSKLAVQEARRSNAKDALAQAYKLLDLAYKENGEIDKAVFSDRALRLYEDLGDLRNQAHVLNNQGIIAQELSNWGRALPLYQRSLEILELIGDRSNACLAKYNIAEILSDQGRLDEAEPLLREAIRVWRSQGADADVAEGRRELGKLLARRGDFAGAAELITQAISEQEQAGRSGELLATKVRLCELGVLRGDGAEVLPMIEAVLAESSQVEGGSVFVPMLHRFHGWALMQSGDDDHAEAELLTAFREADARTDRYERLLLADALLALLTKKGRTAADLVTVRATEKEKLGVLVTPSFPAGALAVA